MSDGIPAPNPDFPIPIKNVKGNANIKIQNKNLLPNNLTWQYGYVNDSGGWAGDYTHKNAFSDYIYLKAGTYTISYEIATTIISIAKYNTSKVFIERDQTIYAPNTSKNKTFTLNQDGYIRISHYDDTGSQILDNINNEENQIEIGTTATSYIEHQEQNYPLTLGDIELCKIGTAQDYLFKRNGKWYKHEIFRKLVFNGSENWERQSPTHTKVINLFINIEPYGRALGNGKVYCNIAKMGVAGQVGSQNDTYINVCIPNSVGMNLLLDLSLEQFPSIESFKTYLQGKNMELIYRLANTEITDIEITDTTLIEQLELTLQAKTYKGVTYITTESEELAPELKIQYWKERGSEE